MVSHHGKERDSLRIRGAQHPYAVVKHPSVRRSIVAVALYYVAELQDERRLSATRQFRACRKHARASLTPHLSVAHELCMLHLRPPVGFVVVRMVDALRLGIVVRVAEDRHGIARRAERRTQRPASGQPRHPGRSAGRRRKQKIPSRHIDPPVVPAEKNHFPPFAA